MGWQIRLTESALEHLRNIQDRRVREIILNRIEELARDPESLGHALRYELTGYRSLRVVGQRYRIIYRLDENDRSATVIALGMRSAGNRHDVYRLARRLIQLGLVEPSG